MSQDELNNSDEDDAEVHDESSPNFTQLIEEMTVIMGDRLGSILTKWIEENQKKSVEIIALTEQINALTAQNKKLTETNDERGEQIKALEKKVNQSCTISKEAQTNLLNRTLWKASSVAKIVGKQPHSFG